MMVAPSFKTTGLDYFDTLRAENETDWLPDVFIVPAGYETMRGMRSMIVFGEEGSGKSALCQMLARSAKLTTQPAIPLIVQWQPGVQSEADTSLFVTHFVSEILDLTAQALFQHLAFHPDTFNKSARWVQEALVWLIRQQIQTDPEILLMKLEETAPPEGLNCLREVITRPARTLVAPTAPYPRLMTEVVQTLKSAGFSGLWVMIDGLEAWLAIDGAILGKLLTTLFSALALFDIPGFAVKAMAPREVKSLVSNSTGVSRRRFDVFDLEWEKASLHALCEKRLALACNQPGLKLDALSLDPRLAGWLEKYGGNNPRGWQEFLRDFLNVYLSQEQRQPLPAEKMTEIHRLFPPRMRMDSRGERVFLDYYPVDGLSLSSIAIIRHLYHHPEHACSKPELYYLGLRELDDIPQSPDDANWEAPKAVEGMMDTAIWRIRQVLEPDPKNPRYLTSSRGKGIIRLENCW